MSLIPDLHACTTISGTLDIRVGQGFPGILVTLTKRLGPRIKGEVRPDFQLAVVSEAQSNHVTNRGPLLKFETSVWHGGAW